MIQVFSGLGLSATGMRSNVRDILSQVFPVGSLTFRSEVCDNQSP